MEGIPRKTDMTGIAENIREMSERALDDDRRDLKRRKTDEEDVPYFRSYSDMSIHEDMIADRMRTSAYRLAILRNYEKIRGKVVADIGAGTGILSMFCVHAGAKKVYAIEASEMALGAREVIKENNMENRIEVINAKVEDSTLPEKVDVIVSEWMGYFLLYETMLPSVLLARDRWLKKDGIMLPETATLYLAPFSDTDRYKEREHFWTKEVKSLYKVDMASLVTYANRCVSNHIGVNTVDPENILAHGSEICHLDLVTVNPADLQKVKANFKFKCFGHNKVHGFASWFKVTFPKDVVLSTSPYENSTHWQQSLVYLDQAFDVVQDTTIEGHIEIAQHAQNKRFLDIGITYNVDNGKALHKTCLMNDFVT